MTDQHQVRIEIDSKQDFEMSCTCRVTFVWSSWRLARRSALAHAHVFDGTVPTFVLIERADYVIDETP